ncbi:MAG: hypothetical protein JNM56_32705 [Planctomycetia bacterium]|nr:hypothetical protein [Planctomycetia bacterium]
MKNWLCAIAVVLLTGHSVVRADIGPGPRPRPPIPAPQPAADKSVPMVIEVVDGKPAPAKLVIPKQFAGNMKAAIDANNGDAVAAHQPSRLPTVLAGLFLTLSLAFTGLWVVRSRGILGGKLAAVVLAVLGLLAAGGAVAWANKAPAPLPPERLANNGDRVVIEIVEQGDAVKLVLHKSQVTKMAGNGAAVPGNPGGIGIPAPPPVPLPAPVPLPDRLIKPAPGGALPVVPDKKAPVKPTDAELQ